MLRRPHFLHTLLLSAATLALLVAASQAAELTSVRSWSGPTNTRVVFDFSEMVTAVAPDSGFSSQLVISVPGDPVSRGAGVPVVVKVQDGLVDSIIILAESSSSRFKLMFRSPTDFRMFSLLPDHGKPFRLVVDVKRPGAAVKEERRIAAIAQEIKKDRIRLVAVDAGHGGEDFGATGPQRTYEKTVTLAVSRALVEELDKLPGMRGALIRDGDYFMDHRARYQKAEGMKADVFISIHANSSRKRGRGKGTEVFFLSIRGATDQAVADLADHENAAGLVGGVPEQAEDDLVNILYDVKQEGALKQSQLLAETLLDHITADRRLHIRGVKQAGFLVLKSVEFPSALVETAFINNPVEAKLLRSETFQRQIAKQLATGVKAYFDRAGIGLNGGSNSTAGAPVR